MVEEQFGKYMIIGEVGLNHLGKEDYANDYLNFHLNNSFECLSFQIRENEFYQREEKKHLRLNELFYEKTVDQYCNVAHKKIGLSVSSLDSIKNIINLKFDFFKILSIAAKDTNLIDTLLKKTDAHIYISIGSLNLEEINKIIEMYIDNDRIKFNYTQLSYNSGNINFLNLLDFTSKYENKFSYGHHYINDIPIILSKSIKNCDIFIYLKGSKKVKHPDEAHAIEFKNFTNLLIKIDEIDQILGISGRLFSKNDIPDQNQK
jgi:sialic acid synthase SpsE